MCSLFTAVESLFLTVIPWTTDWPAATSERTVYVSNSTAAVEVGVIGPTIGPGPPDAGATEMIDEEVVLVDAEENPKLKIVRFAKIFLKKEATFDSCSFNRTA